MREKACTCTWILGLALVLGPALLSSTLYAGVPQPVCGNGVLEPGEFCDDGNTIDGDGCNSQCAVEKCGDGILHVNEECDDGNSVDGDGCDSDCNLEEGP